jgi:predicted porin
VTLGRQAPFTFLQAGAYNPFGAAFGLSPTIRLTFGGPWGNDVGDSGWSNAITYNLPTMAGFNAGVQAQAGENSPAEGASYAAAASYASGPFSIAASTQKLRSAEAPKIDLTAPQSQKFSLLNLSYDFGVAKLFTQFGQFKNKGYAAGKRIDTSLYQVGVSVPTSGSGKVLASYGQSTEKPVEGGTTPKTKHSIFTLAYDHNLSKRTDVYVAYMLDDEKLPGYKKGTTYAVGLRHAF